MPAALTPVSLRLSPEDYIDWEETQEERHDYVHGEVFAMSGASRTHNVIAGNLFAALHRALGETDCEVFASDMRVEIEPDGRYTYPDVCAVCGEARFLGPRETTLVNPTLVVEVLSESTEAYDLGDKLEAYRALATLQEIVYVRQDRRRATVYRRADAGRWTLEDVTAGGLTLASVGVDVPLDALYARSGVG